MIKISLKGFAKFMVADAAKQRKILRDYKYPAPEGQAQAAFYRDARECIKTFHSKTNDIAWLNSQALRLSHEAALSYGRQKTRLANNYRAIRQYLNNFSSRHIQILPGIQLSLPIGSLSITIKPDLHFFEKKREKIIKFDFSKEIPSEKMVKIISQAMYEAQSLHGLNLPSSSIQYCDVARGLIHASSRSGARIAREMEAASENVAAIWNSI